MSPAPDAPLRLPGDEPPRDYHFWVRTPEGLYHTSTAAKAAHLLTAARGSYVDAYVCLHHGGNIAGPLGSAGPLVPGYVEADRPTWGSPPLTAAADAP